MELGGDDSLAVPDAPATTGAGLTDRGAFERALGRSLTHARDTNLQVALLFLGLDGFDDVNRDVGHPAGDGLLEAVGRRLAWITGTDGRACRLGGDEFALLHVGAFGRTEPVAFAKRVLRTVRRPLDIGELSSEAIGLVGQQITCSIGIAVGDADSTVHGLLLRAGFAMHTAKGKRERQPNWRGHYEVFEEPGGADHPQREEDAPMQQ